MAEIVYMPKLSDTMTEGVVAAWNKKIGDEVKEGDILAEIETDKATMEFESFYDGVLLHIGVEVGKAAPVNSVLAVIGEKGDDIEKILSTAVAPEDNADSVMRKLHLLHLLNLNQPNSNSSSSSSSSSSGTS